MTEANHDRASSPPLEASAARRLEAPLIAGLVLGGLSVLWTFVMGLTGWYLDPDRLHLFWVVIAVQLVVLVALLARMRHQNRFVRQVGLGAMASAVGAVVVFVGSVLFTGVAYPSYFSDLRAVREEILREQGMPEPEIEETLTRIAASQTPTGQAFAGFMATLGTGFVVSLVGAAFLRRRDPARGDAS